MLNLRTFRAKVLYVSFIVHSHEADASNNLNNAPLVSYTEFYNSTLDHIDLMKEYLTWQSPDRPGQFSYCQYPFIMSIAAKRFVLTKVRGRQESGTGHRTL